MLRKVIIPALFLSSSAFAYDPTVGVDVNPRNSSCVKNNGCIVASSHWATVHNTTTQPRTIFVRYTICPQNETCRSDTYRVIVNTGNWQDNKMMSYLAKYHYNGDFYLDAETTVFDEKYNILNTIKRRGKIQVHG